MMSFPLLRSLVHSLRPLSVLLLVMVFAQPAAAAPLSASGTPGASVTFAWDGLPAASGYNLILFETGGSRLDRKWVNPGRAGCEGGGRCNWTQQTSGDAASWQVKAKTPDGYTSIGRVSFDSSGDTAGGGSGGSDGSGGDAGGGSGTTNEGTSSGPLSANGAPGSSVTYGWDGLAQASGYNLILFETGGSRIGRQWVNPGRGGCEGGGRCSWTQATSAEAASWQVKAKTPSGYTSIGRVSFDGSGTGSNEQPTGAEPTGGGGSTASGNAGGSVGYAWDGLAAASGYNLILFDAGGQRVVRYWVNAAAAGCGSGGRCNWDAQTPENVTDWLVKAKTANGYTPVAEGSVDAPDATAGGGPGDAGSEEPVAEEPAAEEPPVEEAGLPYPRSTVLPGVTFDWSGYRRLARGSDNWSMTWASDGALYTFFGDGPGLGGEGTDAYTSIGLARLNGSTAAGVSGQNLIGGHQPSIAQCMPVQAGDTVENRTWARRCKGTGLHAKSQGLIALGDTLYAWLAPGSAAANYAESRLYKARIGSNAWERAGWAFKKGEARHLIWPTFLQGGRNGAALGDYLYVYAAGFSTDSKPKLEVQQAGKIYLLRASRNANLMLESSWQFFTGLAGGNPTWSSSRGAAKPVFEDPKGVGWATSAILVPPLGRIILMTEHEKSKSSRLGIFEAPDPWGPWRTVFYGLHDGPGQPGKTAFHWGLMPNSFSGDGKGFTMAYTGIETLDALNLLPGRFK